MVDQAEQLRNQVNEKPRAQTISIISGKGGVGKSNTVLNFSIELQKQGKKVLLFDLDIGMGNIDILLGKDTAYSIVDLFNNYMPIHDMIESGPKGLSYIAGGSSLNHLVTMDEDQLNYFYQQYDSLVQDYDYIFFDMGAGANETSLALVLASDECIVVTTPEPTAITDAYSMIKQVISRQKNMKISLIMNRCHHHKEGHTASKRIQQVVKQFLASDLEILGVLPNDHLVQMSVIRQTPYSLLDSHAPISKALRRIVNVYLMEDDSKSHSPVSFVQKLKRFLTVGNR